jgi:molybdenum cofactor synthesis domain-containing protein
MIAILIFYSPFKRDAKVRSSKGATMYNTMILVFLEMKGMMSSTRMPFAVLIPIGKELLNGRVLDTNSQFIAKKLWEIGVEVRRIVTVPDDCHDIAQEIRRAKREGASLIITTGGLGPTPDDMTMMGVGDAIGRKLVENQQALQHVVSRYETLFEQGKVDFRELTIERRKMAFLPEGAVVLRNDVGTAPGAKIVWGKTWVYVLPGVPSEMKSMFDGEVVEDLKRRFGGARLFRLKITVQERDESVVARAIKKVQQSFKDVLIKPEPKGFGLGGMTVNIEVVASEEEGEAILEKASKALQEALDGFLSE